MRRVAFAVLVAAAGQAWASGFSLYEYSAASHAMAGAVIGKAVDASANFFNPATLDDLTNIQFTVGFVTEHPRGRVRVNDGSSQTFDRGFFFLPHLQASMPLPTDFTLGLGLAPEFGLGTDYGDKWTMNWNSVDTMVQGYVISPNLSYAITEDWSVGAGLRFLYFDFEQWSSPMATAGGVPYGTVDNRLKGNNRFADWGWQVGTRYRICDGLAVGLVYKSPIDVTVKGRTSTTVSAYDFTAAEAARAKAEAEYAAYGRTVSRMAGDKAYSVAQGMIVDQVGRGARAANGAASADLELPQSVAFGANWDITDRWHLGGAISWTQWSTIDTLNFRLAGGDKPVELNWTDTCRFSISPSWDFADDWTAILGYTYDMDCCSSNQASTMLPPADRHILTGGIVWRGWGGLELALSYGIIFMQGHDMTTRDALGRDWTLETSWGFCHSGGFSVTYRF